MKVIKYETIVEEVKKMCIKAAHELKPDVVEALKKAYEKEESDFGKAILSQLLENIEIAKRESIPLCQDTGFAVLFVEVGEDVKIEGGSLKEALIEGVRRGYTEGYLRKSVVADPIRRKNTGDNTPPVIYFDIVKGDKLRIIFEPKGGGSENMSAFKMLLPGEGKEGIKKFVIETVKKAGANPCPPIVVGVGIGGTFEYSAFLAKKATVRPLGQRHPDPFYAEFEEELLEEINKLGIGPMGLGGRITALDVHIEVYPCHITSLPVSVNIQCHSDRREEIVL
ncbi:MAG: fumarate hydratase [Candidatus Hydrothermales bacterium]